MTDRLLLEAAAKAAGYTRFEHRPSGTPIVFDDHWREWNPLLHDGAAMRLATILRMMINIEQGQTEVCAHPAVSAADSIVELHNGDPLAATRRAIVRCAAQGVTP